MGGDRFRGKLNQAQLNITVKLIGFRSEKVLAYLDMYYVKGITIRDIVNYTGSKHGNIHRDVTKIARFLNFIELYNEYGRFN
tara:strand:- start:106 stop:351 length:246 start_codon:yes stop_codon:yes gene_type:complete